MFVVPLLAVTCHRFSITNRSNGIGSEVRVPSFLAWVFLVQRSLAFARLCRGSVLGFACAGVMWSGLLRKSFGGIQGRSQRKVVGGAALHLSKNNLKQIVYNYVYTYPNSLSVSIYKLFEFCNTKFDRLILFKNYENVEKKFKSQLKDIIC